MIRTLPVTKAKLERFLYQADTLGSSDKPSEKVIGAGLTITGLISIFSIINQAFPKLLSDRYENITILIAAIVLPIVTSFWARKKVWSVESVIAVVEEALKEAKKIEEAKKSFENNEDFPPNV